MPGKPVLPVTSLPRACRWTVLRGNIPSASPSRSGQICGARYLNAGAGNGAIVGVWYAVRRGFAAARRVLGARSPSWSRGASPAAPCIAIGTLVGLLRGSKLPRAPAAPFEQLPGLLLNGIALPVTVSTIAVALYQSALRRTQPVRPGLCPGPAGAGGPRPPLALRGFSLLPGRSLYLE